MRNIIRHLQEPDCLGVEKQKAQNGQSNSYDCGNGMVRERLQSEFHNKCYICERDRMQLDIEHFRPHRNSNINLQFDWSNLFFACPHCNSLKGDYYNTDVNNEFLNCTNNTHNVIGWINYEIQPLKKKISFTNNHTADLRVANSIKILNQVYYGVDHNGAISTARRFFYAASLRDDIAEFTSEYIMILKRYLSQPSDNDKILLKRLLSKKSRYSAFKIWITVNNFGKNVLQDLLELEEYNKL